ncbi:MAG TPA: lamin tail domain-containing protein [Pyrinomonadaceae bacterium]|nr:lamin tail domain-containing protein [Pyrinomonadaceae bacterium]
MKSFTPKTSLSNSRAFLASLLTCIILVTPLTPIGFASTSRTAPAQSKGAAKQSPATKANPPADAAARRQKDQTVTPSAVGITASKTDNRTTSQPVGPTNTINYTITITNSGSTDALGVVLNDMIDANTTLVPGSIQSTPLANPDSYNVIGNVRIQPTAAQGLLSNDFNPDNGNNTDLRATGPTTSTQNGNVTVNIDGSFSYNPAPGFTGTDTFTYTVTNTTTNKTDTSTVTLTVGPTLIWFINNDPGAPTGNDGRLTSPFTSIAAYNASSPAKDPGDIIFVYTGTAAYSGSLTLANNQQLIGQGVDLTAAIVASQPSFTVPPTSNPLPGAGAAPTITSTGTTVTLNSTGAAGANTIRGVTLGNATTNDISGTGFGTLTVTDTTLNGTGRALNLSTGTLAATFNSITSTSSTAQGISLTGIAGALTSTNGTTISGNTTQCLLVTGSSLAANFGNTSCTGGTDGISLQNNSGANTRTFGTLNVSGGSGNAFLHANGGGNTAITGAATLSSNLNPIEIQSAGNGQTINFSGGATVTKTTTGGAGVAWSGTNTGATLSFSSLSLTTSNGVGLAAGGGGTVNVTTGSISATGSAGQAAPAITTNMVTFNATFTSVSSTNSGNNGNGILLINTLGSLTMNGGAISGAAGDAFRVGNGTASSGGTANITYNGTISTSAARPVNIDNKTSGTVSFGGVPSSGTAMISSTSNGVLLNNNTGATINFTGGLNLSTGGNAAFTATGGGTVNATQNNTTILNTVTTTTGTGVNIATPTNIGGSGVTFRSVTVSNGASNSATNGIILNGTTGAFTVSGDGTQTGGFFNRNSSGGTISRPTGHGVLLTNASNVTLRQLNITNTAFGPTGAGGCPDNCTSDGVRSNGGSNIVLSAVTLQNLGGNGWRANNITGTNAINHNSRVDTWNTAASNGVTVAILSPNNYSGSFTVDRTVFTTSATGADGFLFDVDTNGGNGTVSVTNSEFTAIDQDAVQINHDGAGILNAIVTGNNFHDADATGGDGNNTVVAALAGGGELRFNLDNNTLTNLARLSANQGVLQVQAAGGAAGSSTGAKLTGTMNNNVLTNPGFVSQRRGIMASTEPSAGSHGGHTISIKNNSVQNFQLHGIYSSFTSVAGSDNLNNHINISNNQVGNIALVGQGGGDSGSAIELETNVAADNSGGDVLVNALIQGNTARNNNSSGIGDTMEISNLSGVTTGAGNSTTINATVLGNNLTQQNALGQVFEARNALTSTTSMCLDLNAANTTPNTATGGNGTGFRLTNDAGTYAIEGLGAQTPSNHLSPKNNNSPVTASGTFVNSAGCTASTAPMADLPTLPVPVVPVASGDTSAAGEQLMAEAAARSNVVVSRPLIVLPQAMSLNAVPAKAASADAAQTASREDAEGSRKQTAKRAGQKDDLVQPAVANFPITIGTLGAGKTVTITFSVTVNNPLPSNVTQISNQGRITGTNFSEVFTDDPDVAGTNNPTVTNVIPMPTITINNASVPEPQSGSVQMPFTVVLSNAYTVNVSVNFQTADGSATGGSDFTPTSGGFAFPAGNTFQTIAVPVLSDGDASESDETFTVTLSAPENGTINGTGIATGTITAANPAGTVLISEVRTSGPMGANDEFVELYNNTDATIDISGWALVKSGADCTAAPVVVAVVPASRTIPARGHYLIAGSAYSLGSQATPDQTLLVTDDIEDDRSLALFNTATPANFTSATRRDAVGFGLNTSNNCTLLYEASTLPAALGSTSQYSFARNLISGLPKDTNNGNADFIIVSTTPASVVGNNATPVLGAPGPEATTSPIQRNAVVKSSLIDPMLPANAPPNRVRSSFGANPTNAAFGTLSVQRRFKNTLGVAVTRLRFRIVDLTTFNNRTAGQSDLRVLTSNGVVKDSAGNTVVTVNGLTLEGPPQPNGGGLNSTLTVVLPGGGLAPGNTIDVQFLLGVQEQGGFSFFINTEALPGTGTVAEEATRATKGVTGKQPDANAGGAAKPDKE